MNWWRRLLSIFGFYKQGVESESVGLGASPDRPSNTLEEPDTNVVGFSRQFDSLFIKYAGRIPVPYLRTLAYSESSLNPLNELDKGIDPKTRRFPPTSKHPKGRKDTHWGLFQYSIKNLIGKRGYNERHKTSYTPLDLFDAEINTRLATDSLNRIVSAYNGWAEKHNIPALRMDWNNVNYVRLVTAGWNSGYSRSRGVQLVAKWLNDHGIPVTHFNVFVHAHKVPRATIYLDGRQYDGKRIWQARVARRYFSEARKPIPLDDPTPGRPPGVPRSGGGLVAVLVLALGLGGFLLTGKG